MTPDRIDLVTLNRTTLQRQHLLSRSSDSPMSVVSHLLGLQSQVPGDPYIGLWSRIQDFDPAQLSTLMEERVVVRMVVMRGTIHLLTADDAVGLRAYAQGALDQELRSHGEHKDHLKDIDLAPVLDFAEPHLTAAALTPMQLRALLATEFEHLNSAALALACRNRLPLVQTPPRGLWQKSGGLRLMTLKGWIGRDCTAVSTRRSKEIVRRYLASFGPAMPSDIVAWSRAPILGRTMEEMAPTLRAYASGRSPLLYDLPDAELVRAETRAAPRFLPQYDNLLLSHRDRSRFGDEQRRQSLGQALSAKGTVLIDGRIGAAWHVTRDSTHKPASRAAATLEVQHLDKLDLAERQAVEAEGLRLLSLLTPTAAQHEVRFTLIDS